MTWPTLNAFDWLMLLIAVASVCLTIIIWIDSSRQISDLSYQLKEETDGMNRLINSNKDELILAIYESKDMGMNDSFRDNYFKSRFGISYEKASEMLEYIDKTDDYSLAIKKLIGLIEK